MNLTTEQIEAVVKKLAPGLPSYMPPEAFREGLRHLDANDPFDRETCRFVIAGLMLKALDAMSIEYSLVPGSFFLGEQVGKEGAWPCCAIAAVVEWAEGES